MLQIIVDKAYIMLRFRKWIFRNIKRRDEFVIFI